MKKRFPLVFGVVLACTTLGSAVTYANDGAEDAAPTGLGSIAAQLRVHLPPAEAALLIGRMEALVSGPSDVLQADGTTLSRRLAVEQELAAVTTLPIGIQIEVAESVLATVDKAPANSALDPSLSPDANMPGVLPGGLADLTRRACETAAVQYATLLRAGKASPGGEDLFTLARQHLGEVGLDRDVAMESRTAQCIELRARALNPDTQIDPAALDAAH